MKRSGIETVWILAACVVYVLAYFAIERWFGSEGRWLLIAIAAVAVVGFLFLRRRRG